MVDRSVRVRISADAGPFIRGLATASAAAKGFARDLDTSDSRMSNLVQSSIALGPALVPIGAIAVPAIAALSTGLLAAAGAGAVAVLAFQGVGDALEATNEFAIEPTAANYEQMRQTLSELGPAGREFVAYLQDLRPKMQELQDIAQEGFFPGLTEGIDELLANGPQVETFLENFSSTMGNLAEDAGDRLNDPWWQQFFDYTNTAGPAALDAFLRSIGNVTEGIAGMIQAFDPLSDDVLGGMVNITAEFARWGRELGSSEGFRSFVDYIREVGPEAMQTLGSVAEAIGAIVQAAAPVGDVALDVIQAIAETISAIADSSAGPVLIGVAAGISAISRAIALYNVASGSSLVNMLGKGGLGGVSPAPLGKHAAGVTALTSALSRAGPALAGVAGLGLFMSDMGEQSGLAGDSVNALTGALVGFALTGGPVGAMIGVLGAAYVDMANDADAAEAAVESAQRALSDSPTNFVGNQQAVANAVAETTAYFEEMGLSGAEAADAAAAATSDLASEAENTAEAMSDLTDATGVRVDPSNLQGLQAAAQELAPAFTSAGLSLDDFLHSQSQLKGTGVFGEFFADIRTVGAAWMTAADASISYASAQRFATGATNAEMRAVRRSIDAHNALAEALLATRSAAVAYEQAVDDAWKEARSGTRTLNINTQAGRDNRIALDGVAAGWNNLREGAQQADGAYRRARSNFVSTARAMGATEDQAKRLADRLLEVPDVRPKVDLQDNASGPIDNIRREATALGNYTSTPRVTAEVSQAASALRSIGAMLGAIDGRTATATVTTVHRQVTQAVQQVVPGGHQADGSVLDFYGRGGLRERHIAQIAPAGAWRVWAEDETGGEAYIPLAMSKRPRSRSIADETVRRLGGVVQWLADGGIQRSSLPPPPVVVRESSRSGPMELVGSLTVTNWSTGEARFRGVARDEIAGDRRYQGTVARQGRAT